MPRYIDADALIAEMQECKYANSCTDFQRGVNASVDILSTGVKHMPAADVEEVKRGHWMPSPDGINPIRCSECNMPAPFAAGVNEFGDFECCRYPSSYCPECGAKMDVKKKDNTERVRCKDCVHFKSVALRKRFDGYCELDFITHKGSHFCGNAERRK